MAHVTPSPSARPLSALDVIFTRRSVRAFENKKLDQRTIRSLLDAAVQAPTAMQTEPWLFLVIQDERTLRRYSNLAKSMKAAEMDAQLDKGWPPNSAHRRQFLAGCDGYGEEKSTEWEIFALRSSGTPRFDDSRHRSNTKPSDVPPWSFMPAFCASKKHVTVAKLQQEFVASQ